MSQPTTLHRGRKTVAATLIAAAALVLAVCNDSESYAAGATPAASGAQPGSSDASTSWNPAAFGGRSTARRVPNERQPFPLRWPHGGAGLDQSAATHPGTHPGAFVKQVNVP
ncbi:hypothetical protein [Streptomyces sp. NPDC101393]|uniref:hypothetical protein n=1 Tax=Streptomyces sp. NPDC101393 TaxID=3366141 RepID=UPI003802F907